MPEQPALPEHLTKPHLRNFQPLGVEKDGQQFAALRDPSLISQQMLVVPPQALQVVARFDGNNSLQQISGAMGVPMAVLTDLVKKLDEVGMLWGPTFEAIEQRLREKFHADGVIAAPHAGLWGDDEARCRARIESLLESAEDPELHAVVTGLVAPHLDPERMAELYGTAYRALVGRTPPARVLLLGTNHFGIGDGIVMSRLGFATPLGLVRADGPVIESLVASLGDRLLKDELDHLGEHSVQLHLPWIQHLFGDVPVVAALVPDPNAPMLADDGARVSVDEFIPALRGALHQAAGETFVIASCDLSHVGRQFQDPRPVDEAQQDEVERHDREMLALYLDRDPQRFASTMAANGNPTRWCSVGAMTVAAAITPPGSLELIEYRQSMDPQRIGLVSCAAIAFIAASK